MLSFPFRVSSQCLADVQGKPQRCPALTMASRAAPHVLQLPRGPLPGTRCVSRNVTHTAAWPRSPPFQHVPAPLCPLARSGCCRQHVQSVPPPAPGTLRCARGAQDHQPSRDRPPRLSRRPCWASQPSSTCPKNGVTPWLLPRGAWQPDLCHPGAILLQGGSPDLNFSFS